MRTVTRLIRFGGLDDVHGWVFRFGRRPEGALANFLDGPIDQVLCPDRDFFDHSTCLLRAGDQFLALSKQPLTFVIGP